MGVKMVDVGMTLSPFLFENANSRSKTRCEYGMTGNIFEQNQTAWLSPGCLAQLPSSCRLICLADTATQARSSHQHLPIHGPNNAI